MQEQRKCCHFPGEHAGPQADRTAVPLPTAFLCFNRAAIYLPRVLCGVVLPLPLAGPSEPAHLWQRVPGRGHAKSDWQTSTRCQLPDKGGKLVVSWHSEEVPPENGLLFLGP